MTKYNPNNGFGLFVALCLKIKVIWTNTFPSGSSVWRLEASQKHRPESRRATLDFLVECDFGLLWLDIGSSYTKYIYIGARNNVLLR